MRKIVSLLLLIGLCLTTTISASAQANFTDVSRSHWAYEAIQTAVEKNIIDGYGDNTFRPNLKVTEEQFAKIALLTLGESAIESEEGAYWSDPYYDYFKEKNIRSLEGYQSTFLRKQEMNRGQVIQLVVELVSGEFMSVEEAIDYAFEQRLTNGKYPNKRTNMEQFAPQEYLTRAEAVVFMSRVQAVLDGEELPEIEVPQKTKSFIQVNGIGVGNSLQHVTAVLGQPKQSYLNEYGINWNIYHKDYNNFVMAGFVNNEVAAIYTNQDIFTLDNGISFGKTKQEIRQILGEPLQYILKGYTKYQIDSGGEYDTYNIDGYYTTFFYDIHRNNQLTAIQVIKDELEMEKPGFYGKPSAELRNAFEKTNFEVTNALRKRENLPVFSWSEEAKTAARLHSEDMAKNNYFSHVNLNGESPFTRMEKQGIRYSYAAENIAYGYTSAIFAHEGWMNSLGHRNNILNKNLKILGVGVALQEGTNIPFYTQNFYTKLK